MFTFLPYFLFCVFSLFILLHFSSFIHLCLPIIFHSIICYHLMGNISSLLQVNVCLFYAFLLSSTCSCGTIFLLQDEHEFLRGKIFHFVMVSLVAYKSEIEYFCDMIKILLGIKVVLVGLYFFEIIADGKIA